MLQTVKVDFLFINNAAKIDMGGVNLHLEWRCWWLLGEAEEEK